MRLLWETRRRLVLLVAAVAVAVAAAFYAGSGGDEEAPRLLPPPVTDFSCTAMTVRAEDGVIQCFDGPTVTLAGILYRQAEHKAPLELLVIGDALQCQRIGRHESGATLARCTTSDGVDLACAMDPANIAARDIRSLCLPGGGTSPP